MPLDAIKRQAYMSALPRRLREEIRERERNRMNFTQKHAEPRMAPAKAAAVYARILRASWLDNPAMAGLEGAMTR
jgi:hypothetical protein